MEKSEIFLKRLSHKVRTPFANISMSATNTQNIIAGENVKIEKQQLDICNTLIDNIKHNIEWCNWYITLLEVGAREINKQNFPLSSCSIKTILAKALEKYFRANKSQVKVFNNVEDFDFSGNECLIKQVLFYLLDNAVFSVNYAKKGEILISSWREKGFNFLSFKDTGAGISEKYLDKIYKNGFSTKNEPGYGLYFAKRAMTLVGGKISCNSKENEYASFILKFPEL